MNMPWSGQDSYQMCICFGSADCIHLFTTARAVDIRAAIPFPALNRVARIQCLTALHGLEQMSLVGIEPNPFAVSAAVYGDMFVGNLFHTMPALGTFQAVRIRGCVPFLFLLSFLVWLQYYRPALVTFHLNVLLEAANTLNKFKAGLIDGSYACESAAVGVVAALWTRHRFFTIATGLRALRLLY